METRFRVKDERSRQSHRLKPAAQVAGLVEQCDCPDQMVRYLRTCRYNAKQFHMSNETIDYHTDPYSLAEKLDAAGVLRAAPQLKINLFACACCRLIWPQLPPMAQLALEVAERFDTGLA